MHKEQYQKAFSGVRPSEQSVERILTMTEKKQNHVKKGWIIALAAALILLCALFTANAATDGAIFNGELIRGLIVRINGKDTLLEDYLITIEETTDENGDPVVKHSYDLPDDKKIEVYAAENYTAFAMEASNADSDQIMRE